MGNPKPRRRKGQGGLFIIRKTAWNEFKQTYEEVDFYRATKDIQDPSNPNKRKTITGTGRSPQEAQTRLNRSLERFYQKKGLARAGIITKSRQSGVESLSEHFEGWYSNIRTDRVSTTLRLKYKQHFYNHILPELGNTKLPDLNYQQLQRFIYDALPAKRKIKGGVELDEPLLGINAILNIYRTFNVCLNVAVKMGKIPRNPLELVDTPQYTPPKENIPQMAHVVDHIFRQLKETNDPLFDHFLLALLGLRRGERLGLTFSSLTLTGSTPKITIQNQLTRVTGQGLFIKPTTKSGKDRTVTLQEPWLSSLIRLKEKRKQQLKLTTFKPEEQFKDLVFLKDNGKPYGLNEDNELWNEINKTYNAKKSPIRGHALRHVAATKMADAGVTRDVAMAILGHESEAISFYYGRMGAIGQKDQVEVFGSQLTESIQKRRR